MTDLLDSAPASASGPAGSRFVRLLVADVGLDGSTGDVVEEWVHRDHIVRIGIHRDPDRLGGTLCLLLTLTTGEVLVVPAAACPDPSRAGDVAATAVRTLIEDPAAGVLTAGRVR